MIPTFIIIGLLKRVINETTIITLSMVATLTSSTTTFMHLLASGLQALQLLAEITFDILTRPKHKTIAHNRKLKSHATAIPEQFMVLSEVMLRTWFVGYLIKVGIQFKLCNHTWGPAIRKHSDSMLSECVRCRSIMTHRFESMLIAMMLVQVMFTSKMIDVNKQWTQHNYDFSSNTQLFHDKARPSMNLTHRNNTFTPPLCLTSIGSDSIQETILANGVNPGTDESFSFQSIPTEFGTDNCATRHICAQRELFTNIEQPSVEIGVQGISGSSSALGVGDVRFQLKDDDGVQHNITLQNTIFLPNAAKNLISITQWSADNDDDCGVMSRGGHTVFKWNNDKHTKTIFHPPGCPIPLMSVNESDDPFALFVDRHKDKFIDDDRVYHDTILTSDKQSDSEGYDVLDTTTTPLTNGSTVRAFINGKKIICTLIKTMKLSNGENRVQVRPLNSEKKFTLQPDTITTIRPDPSDIPTSPDHIDRQLITHELTAEEAAQLWSPSSDDTVPHEDRVTLHWHHRLRCAPLITLKRLAKRGVLPKCILKVSRMPLCASCAFSKAHRRGWRVRGGKQHHIRRET